MRKSNILSVAFLITGNSVGSGLLALPICVGLAGIIPGVIIIVLSCLFMTSTGLILAEVVNNKKSAEFDLPSIYGELLGNGFKWIAIAANLIVLYGLLVAYLSCLSTIAASTLNLNTVYTPLIIFIIITSVNFFAIHIIKHCNFILVVLLFLSFLFLIYFTVKNINTENYQHLEWKLFFVSLPVLVNSFNFHNMIPIACRLLDFNKRRSVAAIITGIFFSFVLNFLWCIAVLGVLQFSGSGNSIIESFKMNLPATVPLARILHSKLFTFAAIVFAAVAIITSYWTVGAALTGFISDLRRNLLKKQPNLSTDIMFTFIPPLLITVTFPNVFISIQDVIGGIGIAVLFGLLPAFILFRNSSFMKKNLAVILIIFFSIVFIFSILQRSGFIKVV